MTAEKVYEPDLEDGCNFYDESKDGSIHDPLHVQGWDPLVEEFRDAGHNVIKYIEHRRNRGC